MLEIIMGNIIFAGLIWGWYVYVQGDQRLTIAAAILAGAANLLGTVIGYRLNRRRRAENKRIGKAAPVDPSVFDRIE